MRFKDSNVGVPRDFEIEYSKKAKLDALDKEILTILSCEGRLSLTRIAKKVSLSADAVKYRLQRMIKDKIINGFTVIVNPSSLGLPLYVHVAFALKNIDLETENKLIEYLKEAPYIVYAAKAVGSFNLFAEIFCRDPNHLDEIMTRIRGKFSDLIKEIEICPIIKEYKWTEFPGVID